MYDVVIVGGGIIGQSISYYLNKNGVRAVVIESGRSGGKATRAAAGMLGVHTENEAPHLFHQFCAESRDLYPSLSGELRELTAIDIGLSSFGMYEAAVNEAHREKLQAKKHSFSNLEWLEADKAGEKIPLLYNRTMGVLYMKEDGHVEPARVCEAFKRGALLHGGELLEDTQVVEIEKEGGSFKVQTERQLIYGEKVILASGAESGRWFEKTGQKNPMIPTKGECFSIRSSRSHLKETLFFEDFYLVPKPDGRMIIGATSKPKDSSATVTGGGLSSLMNKVFAILPELKEAPLVDYWSGVRPGTVDGRPIIGEHPHLHGFFFATGHYRNGILLAPATGQLITALILDGGSRPYQGMLSPKRFIKEGEIPYENSN
ncbi:glycine oxidase ThiO [Halobacillus sp. Marseille-Q1614]|uniref:glycine oxidase ThiO n=1 Tax=Halobacillus sp. Marseille-Q1614 TaxID=2709134 RepID=UPI0015712A3B|nr:glycine oxidase ThiO [Halobacillus sp. Marseille-Q1614]